MLAFKEWPTATAMPWRSSIVPVTAAPRPEPVEAATLRDPSSGRAMRVSTSEPGVQLYTSNFLDGVAGKRGAIHLRHAALCLETQRFPDAVHHDGFSSIVLRPGETYRQRTVYAFGSD